MLYDQTEPQLVTKLLLQVSVRELHNSLVSDPNDGGLKDARDEDGKIIISDSTVVIWQLPDDQQNLKDIIDAAILSTPEGVTDNSTNVHMTSKPVKKPSARKSLWLFTNILDVKPTTAKRRFVAAKSRLKSMKVCNSLWKKKKGHSKINELIKRNM